jgi:GNAT superfamily N-acetyltransferase
MRIDVYQHGNDSLWIALGPYLCDRAVHKELGSPIYSTTGMMWLVARNGAGRVIGFASLRAHGLATWLDYAYVVPTTRSKGVFARLSAERERLAKDAKLPLRTVVRQTRWEHYRERGWKVVRKRGSWIYATKEAP